MFQYIKQLYYGIIGNPYFDEPEENAKLDEIIEELPSAQETGRDDLPGGLDHGGPHALLQLTRAPVDRPGGAAEGGGHA